MKISYRREIKHNYLIIDPEALIWRNYECRMLADNQIDGVLHFQLRQIDDEIRFYYEITSRQPLKRMLESCSIREDEIRHLVLGISGILDRMEQYLLRESSVLLEPEYIYVDPETFRIWLCLVPGLDWDFPEAYSKLLEYLLGKVDHQDKNAVVLAYGLYQETRKENYGMDDILRLLWSGEEVHAKADEQSGGGNGAEYRNGAEYEIEAECETAWEGKAVHLTEHTARRDAGGFAAGQERKGRRQKEQKQKEREKRGSLLGRLRNWLKREKGSEKSEKDGWVCGGLTQQTNPPWEHIFREEPEPISYERYEKPAQDRVQEPEQAWGQDREQDRNTTLLADLSKEPGPGTRYLRALDAELEDIAVAYFPFIIGKQEHVVDFVLDRDPVSRLHLRIDQNDDGWTIQDLNSTNGTIVGGKLLENNESADLHIGDEVRIAGFSYRFE